MLRLFSGGQGGGTVLGGGVPYSQRFKVREQKVVTNNLFGLLGLLLTTFGLVTNNLWACY